MSASFDLMALDRRVARLVADHRRACAALATSSTSAAGSLAEVSHLDDPWLDAERHEELAGLDDVLARALAGWVAALREERAEWPSRLAEARLWHAPHPVPHLEAPVSLASLRRAILAERSSGRADQHTEAFSQRVDRLSGTVITAWTERLERSRGALEVHRLSEGGAKRVAERLLRRTDDLARAIAAPSPAGSLRAALGRDAGDGWPAKLNAAWLEDRLRPAGWLSGRRPRGPLVTAPLGATSFARSLGAVGVALLAEGRNPSLPWCMHQHPRGARRHRRRALFAGLVASVAFGRAALGLGRDRAREQRRRVARAFTVSLRIDSARVIWLAGLASGEGEGRELFAEVGERVFGRAPPRSWLGALPSLNAGDAPWLVGTVLGADDTRGLVERFDEDWFANHRAAEAVKAEDAGPYRDEALSDEALETLTDRLVAELEGAAA